MIENPDVDKFQCSLELLGDVEVGLWRFRNPWGMVVRKDHRGGVVFEGFLENLTWIDRRAVDCAAEEIFASNKLVAFGEINHAEDFVIESA
jgi:hypothetical protein